jgi:tRNA threonylcarbamoyladenosine biosynthesis protein TsaB
MLTLAVDTSTKSGSVAILRAEAVLGAIASSGAEPHSSGLFLDLHRLLEQLEIGLADFELFAVAAGPGSFTGLRIGLTAVRAWAEAFSRPVAAVSSLKAIAIQALNTPGITRGTLVAAVQDARRGQVFGGIYEYLDVDGPDPLMPLGEEIVWGAPEFVTLVARQSGTREPVFASPVPEIFRPVVEGSELKGSRIVQVSGLLAPFIGRIGYAQALRRDTIDALRLDANYVRRTDAELKWKD